MPLFGKGTLAAQTAAPLGIQFPASGHIAPEFERLANVLLGRGCGNPALITYPHDAAFEFLDSVDFSSLHPLDTMKLRNKDQNVISRHC